jgi:5-methylcytosine-specific restriction endonuclease McrA
MFQNMKMAYNNSNYYERTPRSRIKGFLRQIFLKSKERAAALKRDNYTCQKCGKKKSQKKGQEVKVEVHHKKGIKVWDDIINMIYDELLCDPKDLETLCRDCHREETY